MVDITSITTAISSLQTAGQIALGMMKLKAATDIQVQVSELYSAILQAQGEALLAQGAQSALVQEIRTLEAKIAGFEQWDREKERYQLADVGMGVVAYALKAERANGEPAHVLCPRCYQQRTKSFLQPTERLERGVRIHECPECKRTFASAKRAYVTAMTAEGIEEGRGA